MDSEKAVAVEGISSSEADDQVEVEAETEVEAQAVETTEDSPRALDDPSDSEDGAPEPDQPDANHIQDVDAESSHANSERDLAELEQVSDEEVEDSVNDPLEELRSEIQEKNQELEELESELDRAQRESSVLGSRVGRLRGYLDSTESSIAQVDEAHRDLQAWVASRRNSFAWRLMERLDQEREKAQTRQNQLRVELSEPIQAPVLTPSLLQDRFMKTSYLGLSIVLGIASVLLILQRVLPEDVTGFAAPLNPLSWPWWVIAVVGALIVLLVVIKALTTYYRSNSQRQWAIRVIQADLENREMKAHALKRELQRLQSLHEQIPGYFRFLSEVLHRPWSEPTIVKSEAADDETLAPADTNGMDVIPVEEPTTPEELVFGSKRPSDQAFPSLLRLAEPVPGSGGAQEQVLIRETVQDILRPGWRFDSLIRLIESVEQTHQLTPGTFAVDRMDRDPRLREAFLEYLSTDAARTEAGRRYLRMLSRRIQSQVMDEVHPPVSDLSPDPTGHLEIDEDALPGTRRGVKQWDDFLAEALGEGTGWSPLLFGQHSLQYFPHARSDLSVIAFGPARLQEACAEGVSYIPEQEDSIRPIDLVVRIEATTEALGPTAFKVFEKSDSPAEVDFGDRIALVDHESEFSEPPGQVSDDIML